MKIIPAVFIIFFYSCHHHRHEQAKILPEFDSVNRRLQKLNEGLEKNTEELYRALASAYSENFAERLRSGIAGCFSYLDELKKRFAFFCGGNNEALTQASEDKIDLTNRFFIREDSADGLFYELADIRLLLTSHSDDSFLDEKILNATGMAEEMKPGTFMRRYFYNVPPVAAFTILSKFENDIKRVEKLVLQNLLKDPHVSPH